MVNIFGWEKIYGGGNEYVDSFAFHKPTFPQAQRTQDSLYNMNHFSDRNQFEGRVTCIGSKFGQEVV